MRAIEFRYVWKHEKSLCTGFYSLSDIANGVAIPPKSRVGNTMQYWELIAKDQFTGLHVTGGKLFQGDLIMDHLGVGEVVWSSKNCAFKVSYRNENKGTGKWFADYLESEFKSIEIIGNIHEAK